MKKYEYLALVRIEETGEVLAEVRAYSMESLEEQLRKLENAVKADEGKRNCGDCGTDISSQPEGEDTCESCANIRQLGNNGE